jgi:hypothetical protein
MKDVSERGGTVREKETAGRDGPLAPAARRAAKMLLKKNDADADAEKRDVSDDVSASREKEKEDVSREDREVFGSAADAILAAADAAAARGPVGTGGARARGARESSGSGRRNRREGLDGFQARARALEASQGRSGGAHAHRARRGVVPRRGGGTFPEEGFFVSFFLVFFLSSASEEALLHSAARLFRAESVFSRSQKDVRAAALVAQF